MFFPPLYLFLAYVLDLIVGDPRWMPHPIRWIGQWISRCEKLLEGPRASAAEQKLRGIVFWALVTGTVTVVSAVALALAWSAHGVLDALLDVWMAFTALATRSLHAESAVVARALEAGHISQARERLAWIVSRDTSQLEERDIVRALVETVAENISDGIVAPLFYLALGGPVLGMAYKAMNTMDSMVGYLNDKYRHFGWCAARMDDWVNWLPSRLSGYLIVCAAGILGMDRRKAGEIMRRDAHKMKSPNAGYPEAAAAGALGVQLGGANVYFGQKVEKPTLGDPLAPLSLGVYSSMIRLMYLTSILACVMAMALRYLVCSMWS